jgi:hypothetical protein
VGFTTFLLKMNDAIDTANISNSISLLSLSPILSPSLTDSTPFLPISNVISQNNQINQANLTKGVKMIKYPSKITSRPVERWVKVNMYPLKLSWESKKKSEYSTVDFHSILGLLLFNFQK